MLLGNLYVVVVGAQPIARFDALADSPHLPLLWPLAGRLVM